MFGFEVNRLSLNINSAPQVQKVFERTNVKRFHMMLKPVTLLCVLALVWSILIYFVDQNLVIVVRFSALTLIQIAWAILTQTKFKYHALIPLLTWVSFITDALLGFYQAQTIPSDALCAPTPTLIVHWCVCSQLD